MNTKQTISKKYGKNAGGKIYPFSSARQALRGSRVAQGGVGITTGQNPVALERTSGKGWTA